MLHTTSTMADQVGTGNATNTQLWQSAFTVNDLKEEECKDVDFVEDKVQISETAIVIDNIVFQDHLIGDKLKQYDIPTALDDIKTELSLPKVQYDVTHNSFETEEGHSTDNIKIESDSGLLYCEDCHAYYEDYCAKCGMLVHILNRIVPINADNSSRDQLPNSILEIRDNFGEYSVFASKSVPAGVKFGPFTGLNTTERAWKIKGGKFVVNEDESKHLNWMKYINAARNISEQNLRIFQYEHNVYYQSIRQIEEGDELLVHFGEEYDDSLNRNVAMDFIPTIEHIFKDVFACTFCCLGFSSKSHLAKHKTVCPGNATGRFSVEELVQCPTCEIHLDPKEFTVHHMVYCCGRNYRKCILPTTGDRKTQVPMRKTRPCQTYKCHQCKYRTKYIGDLKNHTSQHCDVKTYKCGICCRRYKTKEILRLHVEDTHNGADGKDDLEHSSGLYMNAAHIKADDSRSQDETKPFACSRCAFRTKHKLNLKRHITVKHLKEFKYKCDTCDYRTSFRNYLRTHIETRHLKEFKHKCDTCDYKTNVKSNLDIHVKARHLKEFTYKCDWCDYKAIQKSQLKIHIETKHLNEFKYKCDTCDYISNQKYRLKKHILARHIKGYKYKCDICDYKTNLKYNLKRHMETRHLKEFKYKCDTCDFKANLMSQLKTHMETRHSKEFKYKCDACDYRASQRFQLKRHIETLHLKEFKYKCDACDYKANLRSQLKTHIKTRHLKEFRYKCDICDYKGNVKSNLKAHIERIHLKEFKYKCDGCDYKTDVKSSLVRHREAKHLKEFKYKCDECDFKANWKPYLKTHMETRHSKEFKHNCDACDYKANQKSLLKRHIESKHLKELKYKCDTCDYKTNVKFCLKRHIQKRHTTEFIGQT